MPLAPRRAVPVVCALALVAWALPGLVGARHPSTAFADEIDRLSESGGYFDTDNLISNERSYLDVVPALVASGLSGGAYIGVGPDQNFSYIARVRPDVAYIVDIRRDNLLLHLLFKAIFAHAPNRAAYLSLLTGRAPPARIADWDAAPVDAIVDRVGRAQPAPADIIDGLRDALDRTIRSFGVPLSPADAATIRRFHAAFIEGGMALRFNSHGRPPRPSYPTLAELVLATDTAGRHWNYLASESDYQFLRGLQARDLMVPVVGDLSGPHAMAAIAAAIARRGIAVSAFYVSNVESYLYGRAAYQRFVGNIRLLPRAPRSVMIRSTFGGAASRSVVQPLNEMLAGQ
jgi:hypothetical protein